MEWFSLKLHFSYSLCTLHFAAEFDSKEIIKIISIINTFSKKKKIPNMFLQFTITLKSAPFINNIREISNSN